MSDILHESSLEDFKRRQVDGLLDATRYLNILCLLTQVEDPKVKVWMSRTLSALAALFFVPPSQPTSPAQEGTSNVDTPSS
jgi:hypothetical protein